MLFGSDLPYGPITGVECWSEQRGAIFLSRDDYAWSDPAVQRAHAAERARLTCNTYHTLQSVKTAVMRLGLTGKGETALKEKVFHRNAAALFGVASRRME